MIPLDAVFSPAGLAKAAARLGLPRPPASRPGISPQGNAAAMAAHLGGKSATTIRGVEVPGALVDATAAYSVIGSLLSTTRWLQAERITEQLHAPGCGLEGLAQRLAGFDVETLLDDPSRWPELAGVALIQPDHDMFAVRGRGSEEKQDRTTTTTIMRSRMPVWQMFPRVVASHLFTGRMPPILLAYTWQPEGVAPGCKPVALPGGIVFDARLNKRRGDRFGDLSLALAEVGLRAKEGKLSGIDPYAQRRMAGAVKVARNGVSYGLPVEFNPSRHKHPAWGPDGCLSVLTNEEPGWLADPPVGALATAGCELLLTLLEILIDRAVVSTSFVDTDAAFVALSRDGTNVEIDGRGADGEYHPQQIGTLTTQRLVSVLNRFGPIAAQTTLSIPAYTLTAERDGYRLEKTDPPGDLYSVFKIAPENLIDGNLWTPGLTCYATEQKRYVLHRTRNGGLTTPKSSAHVIGTLANFRPDGALDWKAIEEAWLIGLALAEGREVAASECLHLEDPVLQPLTLAHPRDWRALGKLCFSSLNPDGIRPFETVIVPVPSGKPRGRIVAPLEPDRAKWPALVFRNRRGTTYQIRTADRLHQGFGAKAERVQVVPSLREWLCDYFTSPEPLSLGPDDKACGPQTRGVLLPQPVEIIGITVAGQEPHRRRDEEAVAGWDVQIRQATLAVYRSCQASRCDRALSGRQKRWCAEHAKRSGNRRRRWKQSARACACPCGEAIESSDPRKRYVDGTHRKRAARERRRNTDPTPSAFNPLRSRS